MIPDTGPGGEVKSIVCMMDGVSLAVAHRSQTVVHLWHSETGQSRMVLPMGYSRDLAACRVLDLAVTTDGCVVGACQDKILRVWR